MKYALLIGLNYSTTNNRLYGCINDCLLVQSMLVNNYGYQPNNIVFMRDDIYLSNSSLFPNRTNIMSNINELISKSNDSNCQSIYLHYSGHGSQIKDTNSDEKDGMDEFIVPFDYFTNGSRIIDDELYNLIINVNDNVPFFVVFDCCCSGTILDLNNSYGYVNNVLSVTQDNGNPVARKKIICISACSDSQAALDVTKNGTSNGAMTLALYSVLQASNWNILLKDLLNNIYNFLKVNRYTSMSPVLSSNFFINLDTQYFNTVINVTATANNNVTAHVNSAMTLLSSGVTNVISTPNVIPLIQVNNASQPVKTQTASVQSNVSIITPLLQHLISTNYISVNELTLIINALKN
jgi:hypothetical protein